MAEKKSTDVDVLEAQLRKLGFGSEESNASSRHGSVEPNGTPQRGSLARPQLTRTPVSGSGSVYHTPESRFSGGRRSTPGTLQRSYGVSAEGASQLVSKEDSERWEDRATRRKVVHDLLREGLAERRKLSQAARAERMKG